MGQTVHGREKRFNVMASNISRQREYFVAVWSKEQSITTPSSFFPDFYFSLPASARRCSSICHPYSPVTLPLLFSNSWLNFQYCFAIHQQYWLE